MLYIDNGENKQHNDISTLMRLCLCFLVAVGVHVEKIADLLLIGLHSIRVYQRGKNQTKKNWTACSRNGQ